MASDALIAGVAGVVGVTLSGGVQTYLAWRADRRSRRRAVRVLAEEMEAAVVNLRHIAGRPATRGTFLRALRAPVVFPREHDELARELSLSHWRAVKDAYLFYDLVLSGVELSEEPTHRDGAPANMVFGALERMEKAIYLVAPYRDRVRLRIWARRRQRTPEGRALQDERDKSFALETWTPEGGHGS